MTGSPRLSRWVLASVFCAVAGAAGAQDAKELGLAPPYSIWDVKIGSPAAEIPERIVNDISCGTNGGPPSLPIGTFADFAKCSPEPSGLHEVYFTYDDERDYIALAMGNPFRSFQGGTSAFAHPVIVSVLISDDGVVRGVRLITDNRASLDDRRQAVWLGRNLKARFQSYNLDCQQIPPADGEQPYSGILVHEICAGHSPDGMLNVRFESSMLLKKGQAVPDPKTQLLNPSYFESVTSMDLVQAPYKPSTSTIR